MRRRFSAGLVHRWWLFKKDIIISLHLMGLSWKRLVVDHIEIWSTSDCKELCMDFSTTSETVVSLANFHIFKEISGRVRAFIIARNNQGPSRVPWGTPAGTNQPIRETIFMYFYSLPSIT